jgi:hypothetical protein
MPSQHIDRKQIPGFQSFDGAPPMSPARDTPVRFSKTPKMTHCSPQSGSRPPPNQSYGTTPVQRMQEKLIDAWVVRLSP